MRRRDLALIVAFPLLAGCVDSLGIGSSCSAEMRAVQVAHGQPLDSDRVNEGGGDFSELWIYANSRYTFRWGPSYESCRVEGPVRFSRGPAGARIPILTR